MNISAPVARATTTATTPAPTPAPGQGIPWAKMWCDNHGDISYYGFNRTYAYADSVIGSEFGYPTMDACKAAVDQLFPVVNPTETDDAKMQHAVAYVDSGYGSFAALELDSPLVYRTMFRHRLVNTDAFSMTPGNDQIGKVVTVRDYRGKFLANLGYDDRV